MATLTEADIRPVSRMFKALGDETRLRIVALLSHGELCVCHFQSALGLPQPHVSRHLAILRGAGIVADRREGTWVYYRLVKQDHPERERHLRDLVSAFAGRSALRQDVRRLLKGCGPGACQ